VQCGVDTNKLQENEKCLEIGGLDTPLYECFDKLSTPHSGLLDHRSLVEI